MTIHHELCKREDVQGGEGGLIIPICMQASGYSMLRYRYGTSVLICLKLPVIKRTTTVKRVCV